MATASAETSPEEVTSFQETSKVYTLDLLLKKLGHCGRFQVLVVMLGYFPFIPATWSIIFMTFGNYNPGWTCSDALIVNITNSHEHGVNMSKLNTGGSLNKNEAVVSSCALDRFCTNRTFIGIASTIVSEWHLVCEDSYIPSIIISIQMVGVMLASYAAGYIGDRVGRKFNIHGGAALMAVCNFLAIFSTSWKMYAVFRFCIGLSCGCILSTAIIYVFEFIPAWWRGIVGTSPIWNLGTFSFGLCVLALKDWKQVHLVTAFLSLLGLLPVFWLPESLRFLTVRGKLHRANKVVRQMSLLNHEPMPDTSAINCVAENERKNTKNRPRYTYLDLFKHGMLKPFIVMGSSWFVLAIGYFMIGFGIRELSGDFFVNLLLFSVLAVPTRLVATVLVTKVGRKIACVLFLALGAACSLSVVGIQLLASEQHKAIPTVVLTLGASVMIEATWGAIVVFIGELSTTGIRNMFFGFCNGLGRWGAIFAPYLAPRNSFPLFGGFLIVGLLLVICCICLLTLPETRNKPMQDNLVRNDTVGNDNSETQF